MDAFHLAKAMEEIRISATDVVLRPRTAEEHCAQCSWVPTTQRGFTLLEALIALVIASLALGFLFNAGLTGLLATQAASQDEQAIARARSHLTLAANASPLKAGDWQGDDGSGFAWHLRVTPIVNTTVRPAYAVTPRGSASFPLTLYAVTVWISWADRGNRREVKLDTEQIGQGAQ